MKLGHLIELAARCHQHQGQEHVRTTAAEDSIGVSLAANGSSGCQLDDRDNSRAPTLSQRMTETQTTG